MSLPKSKQDLADWILRRLGAPLVNVEITNEQLEDVIDEAVQQYYEWHYDGTQRSYRSIKITSDMLSGNHRKHQELTAPMYDITQDDEYRIGARTMTYTAGGQPDVIWLKYDSEQQLYQFNYIEDTTGPYYHPSTSADTEFFITSDAQKYFDSDFTVVIGTPTTYIPAAYVVSDSDGGYTAYDSDLHTIFVYDVDSDAGAWVDSEGTFVQYDSEIHTSLVYTVDLLGDWVDSDGNSNFVLYDSDTHTVLVYDSDSFGDWVDSDGTFVLYDSDNTFVGEQRFSRYSSSKIRYSRESVSQPRFSRDRVVNGKRYTRQVVKAFAKEYQWTDLWKEEQKVLIEPTLDLDYSIQGQVGIPIPENIYGISKVFRVSSMQSAGMWSYEYQMFLNNFDWFYGSGGAGSGALTQYYTTKMNIDFIDFMLNTQPAIRFNKHKNRLYIDTNWTNLNKQKEYYLFAEVYEISDPEIYGDIYSDKWLKKYATALAKVQWGSNMKKYTGAQYPGGITVDGQAIYDEGMEESERLLSEMKDATSALFDSIIIG